MKKFRRVAASLINKVLSVFNVQITVSNTGFWDRDPAFLAIYGKIRNRSLVKIDRCFMLYQFAKHASVLSAGDVAQVGVYKGGTAKMIAGCFLKTDKKVFLFDTFEGLPALSEKDRRENGNANNIGGTGRMSDDNKISGGKESKKQFSDVHFEEVKNYLADCPNVEIKKGYFPETARGLEGNKFCFVYLDADLYQSTKDGLEFFYPRMVPGGIIMFDDYQTGNWPGVERAVREFQTKYHIRPITTTWWQGVIICNPSSD